MSLYSMPPEKTGFLKKRGHIRKNWKKRFFILHNNGCLEYQTPNKIFKGNLYLKNYTVKQACELDLKTTLAEYVIHLIPQEINVKPYFLAAKSEKEMKEWISVLSFAADESKKRYRLSKLEENKPVKIFKPIQVKSTEEQFLSKSIELNEFYKRKTTTRRSSLGNMKFTHCNFVTIIYDGPITAYIISLLIEYKYNIKILVTQTLCSPVDDIKDKWLSENELSNISIYTPENLDDCFNNCTSLFIPSSININTLNISTILKKAKDNDIKFIIKLSILGFLDNLGDISKNNLFLQDMVQTLGIHIIHIFTVLPFESIIGFKTVNKHYLQIKNISKLSKDKKISFISIHDIADMCSILLLRKFENLPKENFLLITGFTCTINTISMLLRNNNIHLNINITLDEEYYGNWEYDFDYLLDIIVKSNCTLELPVSNDANIILGRNLLTLDNILSDLKYKRK